MSDFNIENPLLKCSDDYEDERKSCVNCGDKYFEEELKDGLCENCVDRIVENKFTVDFAKSFDGEQGERIKVELPEILASVFSEEQIVEILWAELAKTEKIDRICLNDWTLDFRMENRDELYEFIKCSKEK